MKYKISWLIVLFLSGAAVLFLSFKTAYQINSWTALNTKIKANLEKGEIRQNKKDKFELLTFYNFKVANKNFYKISIFQKKFLNYLTALDFKEKIEKKDFFIWYNKKNPNMSAIEKNFPIKNLIYSIIAFIVFGYFVVLKYYVFSFHKIS